jgi:uncharacterized protein (DUF362 family)
MSNNINRRTFIKSTTVIGATSFITGVPIQWIDNLAMAGTQVDLAAVTGANYFDSTIVAVNALGGMEKFVPKQSRVGLLVNSSWKLPGSYVNPEITLAVVRMCIDAGAGEIGVFKEIEDDYWQRTEISVNFRDEISQILDMGGNFTKVNIPGGISLKSASIAQGLFECDVFINISIGKNHTGTGFTGTLKNMMGASSFMTNQYFHHGSGSLSSYGDVEFLSQCIADLNLVRKPDLCLLDGTEVLKNNGPRGPGELIKPQKVIAGVDRVAVDSYGARLLGLDPEDIFKIRMAREHGLGEIASERVQLQEVTI